MDWLSHPTSFIENGCGIYAGLTLGLIVCGIGLPIPEEATFLAAGFIGRKLGANPWLLCLSGMAGILIGDLIPYFAGRHLGPALMDRPFFRRFLAPEKRTQIEAFFKKRGSKAIFIARFLGGLRTPSFLAAGAMGVPLGVFILWDALGALISCPTSIWLAYLYGERAIEWVEQCQKYVMILAAGIVVLFLFRWWRKQMTRARENGAQASENPPRVGWLRQAFYASVAAMLRIVLKLIFNFEVQGAENVPMNGPVVLAANHASFIDPIFLAACTRRRVRFLMYSTYYFSIANPLFYLFGCIPIDERKYIRALKAGINVLKDGECVGVFPEGAVSYDGNLQPARGGTLLIAQRSGAPVIPVLIKGNHDALPRGAWFPRFKKVTVVVGAPFVVDSSLSRAESIRLLEDMMSTFARQLAVSNQDRESIFTKKALSI